MTNRLTDEELREWLTSLAKVTPGPWEGEKGGRGSWISGANGCWVALSCGDTDEQADAHSEHLLRYDPQTISALLKELLAWRANETGQWARNIHNDALEEAAQQVGMMLFDSLRHNGNKENAVRTILSLKITSDIPRRSDASIRNAALDEAAKVADRFSCGACGMDGKASAAILALKTPEREDG